MRAPLPQDDTDELVMSARSAQEHRAAAAQPEAWANQPHSADADVTQAFPAGQRRRTTHDLVHG